MKMAAFMFFAAGMTLLPNMVALVVNQAPEKGYPVSKVVQLLSDMKAQLEKEQDMDEEVYEKLACWCRTNDQEKTKSIADAQARISDLTATIEKTGALSETLQVEVTALEKEIAKNQKSLEVATALRQKQLASFVAEEKEMVQSIQSLKAAIVVLSKHHGSPALLDRKILAAVAAAVSTHKDILRGALLPHQNNIIASFVQQQAPEYYDATPTFKKKYTAQSGEIFGILKEMLSTFQGNLAESQREEIEAKQAYLDLKEAKESEIKTGQSSLEEKQQVLAGTDEKLVQAKEDKKDTEASLSADERFLMSLKEKCSMTDAEWAQRQKTRQTEITAVAEAISILSKDDARDLFSRTFNPEQAAASFLQAKSKDMKHGREQAASLLERVAEKTNSVSMAALATSLRLDAFTRVKKAIDDMIIHLSRQTSEEIVLRDTCIANLNTNERNTDKEIHAKTNLETKIAGLEMKIKELEQITATLKAEIEELQIQLRKASDNRQAEKKAFEAVVADQKQTIALLEEALGALKTVYRPSVSLMQKKDNRLLQEPPAEFSTYEKQQGAADGVLSLIQQIIADAKLMQDEAEHDEKQAVAAYSKLVEETNASVKERLDSIVDRSAEKSTADQDLITAKGELEGSMDELSALSKSAGDLHKSCDYVIKNFEIRQEARDEEVEALRQAKAFLSGMQA